jgi:Raf kinase inhibitor-like YbhB/YbcL family protein
VFRFIGRRLRGVRADPELRVAADPRFAHAYRTMTLTADFENNTTLPPGNDSPALYWRDVPEDARTLVLIVEDLDAPLPRPLTHAVAYEIAPDSTGLAAGALESTRTTMGFNAMHRRAFIAPTPLPGHGPHRYVFTLLAVDYVPRFDQPPTRERLLDAVAGHVLALAELTGYRER